MFSFWWVNVTGDYFAGIGWNNFRIIIRWPGSEIPGPGLRSRGSFQKHFIERWGNIWSLTTFLLFFRQTIETFKITLLNPWCIVRFLWNFLTIAKLSRVKFYLIVQTFWQGFCSQLVTPSDPSLTVGLLIRAPLLSQPWDDKYLWNLFILKWQISQPWEKHLLAILFNIVPDSLLELPGVSTDCPNLANQLHNAKALFVECPGLYNCMQYHGAI